MIWALGSNRIPESRFSLRAFNFSTYIHTALSYWFGKVWGLLSTRAFLAFDVKLAAKVLLPWIWLAIRNARKRWLFCRAPLLDWKRITCYIFLQLPLNLVESSHEMCNVDVRPIFIVPFFFILNDVYSSLHVFRILRAGRFRGVRRICQVCQGGAKIA
jgi:hypothetical protein